MKPAKPRRTRPRFAPGLPFGAVKAARFKDGPTGLAVAVFAGPGGVFVAVDGGDAVAVDLCRSFSEEACARAAGGCAVAGQPETGTTADGFPITWAQLTHHSFTTATVGVA